MSICPFRSVLILSILLLTASAWGTTVIVNSQDYQDIVSASVYARANDYNFVFALTPNHSIFIARYYSSAKNDPIVYLEGQRSVLPNMAALLRESGLANLTVVQPNRPVWEWVADQMPREEAIVVGGQHGQDALAVSPYAAITSSPLFFIDDPSQAGGVLSSIASRGYKSVLFYGPVAHQIPSTQLSVLPNRRAIDTGSRYSNNVQIVNDFLARVHTAQVMFVSGRTFEKSMVTKQFPLVLVGRSEVSPDVARFVKSSGIKSGIVFAGDADIVDGVNKLRALAPGLSLFVKFGEGFLGNAQMMPLAIVPLPSPVMSLEVLNLTYNVPAKTFELRVANRGDFTAISAGATVTGVGSAESSQLQMDPGSQTSLTIPLDSTRALSGGKIPQVELTVRYGEDLKLMDNLDTFAFSGVPATYYNDTSTVTLAGIEYSSSEKAFIITLEGTGFSEGTIEISINGQPVSIRFPSSEVSGRTSVKVKHLLTGDEEKFINGLSANYFIRSGSRADILLRESRGKSTVRVPSLESPLGGLSPPAAPGSAGGIPWTLLFVGAVLIVGAVLAYQFFMRRGESFD